MDRHGGTTVSPTVWSASLLELGTGAFLDRIEVELYYDEAAFFAGGFESRDTSAWAL